MPLRQSLGIAARRSSVTARGSRDH
jgi:hypothetical protein